MDINLMNANSNANMSADLINHDDKLNGHIAIIERSKKETIFHVVIDTLTAFPDTNKNVFECDIFLIDGNLYFQHMLFNDDNLYHINTQGIQHGINMIKGFFSSNKYRNYAEKHGKRAKLIAEKKRLNRKISQIDKQLD